LSRATVASVTLTSCQSVAVTTPDQDLGADPVAVLEQVHRPGREPVPAGVPRVQRGGQRRVAVRHLGACRGHVTLARGAQPLGVGRVAQLGQRAFFSIWRIRSRVTP
jgi:hypothetical protein